MISSILTSPPYYTSKAVYNDGKRGYETWSDKEEKSLYVYKKLSYLLFRKIGFTNIEASDFLDITTITDNNWFNA